MFRHRSLTLALILTVLGLFGCASPAAETPLPTASNPPTAEASATVPSTTSTPDEPPSTLRDQHGVSMILIPAGEFTMGSNDGAVDERPVHKVFLDAYYIDKLEVGNAAYAACVNAGVCQPPFRGDCCTDAALVLRPKYFGNPQFADYPVIWLSWRQAKTYCEWRGARLPTEAEWEKAARGPDGRTYPWGNEPPTPNRLNFTWLDGEFPGKPLYATSKTGSYPLGASPYGVLDMAGNVYDWVADVYDPGYYAISPYRNPTGPGDGKYRVARGGSFYNQAWRNRVTNRNYDAFLKADQAEFDAGARCALTP